MRQLIVKTTLFVLCLATFLNAFDFRIQSIDTDRNTGVRCKMALDNKSYAHIAYQNISSDDFKYAYEDEFGWHTSVIEHGYSVGYTKDIEIDKNDNVHIMYCGNDTEELYHAVFENGLWSKELVCIEDCSISYITLRMDSKGFPHGVFLKRDRGSNSWPELIYVKKTAEGWHKQVLHYGEDNYDCARYPSLALDENDLPYVSYFDSDTDRILLKSFNGISWQTEIILDDETIRTPTSVAVSSSGKIGIAYVYADHAEDYMYLAVKEDGQWDHSLFEHFDDYGENNISLTFDFQGNPHIAYYVAKVCDLKYATFKNDQWIKQTVDDYREKGKYLELKVNCLGEPHIAYYDGYGDDLKYASPTNYGPRNYSLIAPTNGAWATGDTRFFWCSPTYRGQQVDHYELIIDGQVAKSNISRYTPYCTLESSLADGWHTWKVAAIMQNGSTQYSEESWSFRIDQSPPEPFELTAPENNMWTAETEPTFSWNPSNDSGSLLKCYNLYIDSTLVAEEIDAGMNSFTITSSLADGEHAWYVHAIDNAGHVRSSAEWIFHVDHTGPNYVSLLSPSSGLWTADRRPTFSWEATTDNGVGLDHYDLIILDYSESNIVFQKSVNSDVTQYELQSGEGLQHGRYYWKVVAVDALENTRSSSTRSLRIDLVSPAKVRLNAPADSSTVPLPTPEFEWFETSDLDAGLSHYELWIDSTLSVDDLTVLKTAPSLPLQEGPHKWWIDAVDNVGNKSSSLKRIVYYDWGNPTAFQLKSPDNNSTVNIKLPELSWTASTDNGSGILKYQLWINGELNRDDISGDSLSTNPTNPLEDGEYSWFIRAFDRAGNSKSSPIWKFNVSYIDKQAPTACVMAPNGGEQIPAGSEYSIEFQASDNLSISHILLNYSINNGTSWARIDSIAGRDESEYSYLWSIPEVFSNQCLIQIKAYDTFANEKIDTSDSTFSIIDSSVPFVALKEIPEKLLAGSEFCVEWIASDNDGIVSSQLYFQQDSLSEWENIAQFEDNTQLCLWPLPLLQSKSSRFKIKVADTAGNYSIDSTTTFRVNRPPVIQIIADTTLLEDNNYEFWAIADSIDKGDVPIFSSESDLFSINGRSGMFIINPQNQHVGDHQATIYLSDGMDADTCSFSITIQNVNDAPEHFSLLLPENNSEIDTLNPMFKWEQAFDVDQNDSVFYQIELALDNEFSESYKTWVVQHAKFWMQEDLQSDKKYYWRVVAIDKQNAKTASEIFTFTTANNATGVLNVNQIPLEFALFNNFPNPFNPSTTIKFDIPEMSDVRLEIVNINGKLVRTLVNEHKQAGSYSVVWDATDNSGCAVASGVYLYRLQAGGEVLTKKLLYTK